MDYYRANRTGLCNNITQRDIPAESDALTAARGFCHIEEVRHNPPTSA